MTPPVIPHRIFITGTDTGVGKTVASCELLKKWTKEGKRAAGMKAVAAGTIRTTAGAWVNEDVQALKDASNIVLPDEWISPLIFSDAVSPHLAAKKAAIEIDLLPIKNAYKKIEAITDCTVVEGAGGVMVPLSEKLTGIDLCRTLNLPIVLVVGMRLGCLNHALLTVNCIRQANLDFCGWIVNRMDPAMIMQNENIAYLKEHLSAPLLLDIPYLFNK